MVSEAITGLQALKSLLDTVKGLSDLHTAVAMDQAVFAITREALTAQAAQMALAERVGDLEKELVRFETWATEKQRYELVELPRPGVYAYRIKPAMQGTEPVHHLCTRCYEDGLKSILVTQTRNPGMWQVLYCPRCKADFPTDG